MRLARLTILRSVIGLILFIVMGACSDSGVDKLSKEIGTQELKQDEPEKKKDDPPPLPAEDPEPEEEAVLELRIVGGNQQVGSAADGFSEALRVQLAQDGEAVSGENVFFAIQSGPGGSFSAETSATDDSGIALTNFEPAGDPGVTIIRATYKNLFADFSLTVIDQTDTQITIISGNAQSGEPQTNLDDPLVVQVTRLSDGLPLKDIAIKFVVVQGNARLKGSTNSVDARTDGNGYAEMPLQLGTIAGTNTVRVSIVGNPTGFIEFTAQVVVSASAPISLAKSSISADPVAMPADGVTQTLLKVTTKDVWGNQIPGGGAAIVFLPTDGGLTGSVIDHGDGTYTQYLTSPLTTGTGSLTVGATVDGGAVTAGDATVNLLAGAVDFGVLTVETILSSITADGTSTTTVRVTLKDALANQLSAGGETVVISTTAGALVGSAYDNGDGTYSQTIRSSTVAQNVSISATVGGAPLADTAILKFAPGAADVTTSVVLTSPSAIPSDGITSAIITVLLKDAFNNALDASAGVVAISSTAGSWGGLVIDNNDGTYQRTLISAPAPATATVSAALDGVPLAAEPKVYMTSGDSGPSVATSVVEIVGSDLIPADGSSTTNIKVTLKDNSNTQLDTGGSDVVISTTAGVLVGSIVDNSDGTYQQVIRAPSGSAIGDITATIDGQTIVDTASVSFYGDIDVTNSTVVAVPPAVEADGVSTSLLVLQAKDLNNITIPVGGETLLSFASSDGTLIGGIADNGNGTYTQFLQAPGTGAIATISADLDGTPLSDTADVDFYVPNNVAGITIDCSNINTYKNTAIVVEAGTLTMNSSGDQGDCPADFTFSSVIVRSSGVITHSATTLVQEYGLEFTTSLLSIDNSSSVDVTGKGYPYAGSIGLFRVQGNQNVQNKDSNANSRAGGSHGGEGGRDTNAYAPPFTYGSLFQPTDLGSSGGTTSGGNPPGAGGGRIKINIVNQGTLINDGSILADGAATPQNTVHRGGGAGGSIWIATDALTGTGSISANGGLSYHGGGGGRIAIYYKTVAGNFTFPTNVIANITAYGGAGVNAAWQDGAAGTIYLKAEDQTYGDLIVNNNDRLNTDLARTDLSVPSAAIPDNMTTSTLSKSGAFADRYDAAKMPYVGYYVDPNITQNGTAKRADNTAFRVDTGNASLLLITGGDMLAVANPLTDQAQLMLIFDNVEITGKAVISGNAPIVALKGDISSGNDSHAVVNGQLPEGIEYDGAHVTLDASGAHGSSLPTIREFDDGLVLKNGTFAWDDLVTGADMVLDNATMTIGCTRGSTCWTIGGTLRLKNASTIEQKATTASDEYSIEISTNGLHLDSGNTITAVGKGFLPPNSGTSGFTTFGNVFTHSMFGPHTSAAGASHGGMGAASTNTTYMNMTYGSPTNPYSSGAAARRTTNVATSGGGIIRINVNGGLGTINGTIDASGQDGVCNRTNGAGGSVRLDIGALSGGGTIKANGGSGCWAAGGGRIAVYYNSASGGFTYPTNFLQRVQAYGGAGSTAAYNGAAGTIYLKANAQTYGDLIVDNNSQTSFSWTPIHIPAEGSSNDVTTTTVEGSGFTEDGMLTGYLEGLYVHPDTSENGTPELSDDTMFRIDSHTGSVLTTNGDPSTVGSGGDTYRVVLVLDNLQLDNLGKVAPEGDVLLISGDVNSQDTTSFDGSGGSLILASGSVDFANLGTADFDGGGGTVNMSRLKSTAAGTITLANGTFNIDSIDIFDNFTIDGATVNAGTSAGGVNVTVGSTLTITSAGQLSHPNTTATDEYRLHIQATDVTIDSGAAISVNEKGYPQITDRRFRAEGNQDYVAEGASTNTAAGGSHGGMGGRYSGSYFAMRPYGNMFEPTTLGGSGGWTFAAGKNGGGAIRLEVTGTLTNDGIISANGQTGVGSYPGAGGSIWITTDTLTGSGSITSDGGGSATSGGGGGRIAIYYDTLAGTYAPPGYLGLVHAWGGVGTSVDRNGAAGTVYLKSTGQTHGDLVINNNNLNTSYAKTYLESVTATVSDILNATTLTATSAFTGNHSSVDQFKDYYVIPNLGEDATTTITDNTLEKITANSANSVTIAGDLTTTATSGDPFAVVMRLDNLEVRGNANFEFAGGYFMVEEGDVISDDTASMVIDGTITGAFLDVGSATISVGGNGAPAFDVICDSVGCKTKQWAASVINYSSQHGSYPATRLIGEPDRFAFSWQASTTFLFSAKNIGDQTVTVGFDDDVYASGVIVRECGNPNGFVKEIEVLDTSDVYHSVWSGVDDSPTNVVHNFEVSFATTGYLVKGVRVTVDTANGGNWETMDAIGLIGYAP